MPMIHANTETLSHVAAYAATKSLRAQKPTVGLRFDEITAPAGRRYR